MTRARRRSPRRDAVRGRTLPCREQDCQPAPVRIFHSARAEYPTLGYTRRGRMRMNSAIRAIGASLLALMVALEARAADIGQVKVAKGQVTIERGGQSLPATVGTRVQDGDTVRTGADGTVGITMSD